MTRGDAIAALRPGRGFVLHEHADGTYQLIFDDPSVQQPTAAEIAAQMAIPPRRLVAKALIVDRLMAAGKDAGAFAAFDALPRAMRERWNTRVAVYADDPDMLALLSAIGADPAVILAP